MARLQEELTLEEGRSSETDRLSVDSLHNFIAAVELTEKDPYPWLQLGLLCLMEGQYEQAQDFFKNCLLRDLQCWEAWSNLGEF